MLTILEIPLFMRWTKHATLWEESLHVRERDSDAINLRVYHSASCHGTCSVVFHFHTRYAATFCFVSRCCNSRTLCLCEWEFLGGHPGGVQAFDKQNDLRIVDSSDNRDAHWRMDCQWNRPSSDVLRIRVFYSAMVFTPDSS